MAILTEIPADQNGADAAAQDRQIQPMEHEVQNNDNGRDVGRVSYQQLFFLVKLKCDTEFRSNR